ncbi:MAG: hypothetical protein LBC47_10545 [Tannerella sp.]|nr:hypothetical protein [Tannerella sp.]
MTGRNGGKTQAVNRNREDEQGMGNREWGTGNCERFTVSVRFLLIIAPVRS